MHIIFYGRGYSIASSLMARLYLNNATGSFQLNYERISCLLKEEKKAMGHLLFIDTDCQGNRVYILNCASAEALVINAVHSVLDILKVDRKNVLLIDTSIIEKPNHSLAVALLKYPFLNSLGVQLMIRYFKEKDKDIKGLLQDTLSLIK